MSTRVLTRCGVIALLLHSTALADRFFVPSLNSPIIQSAIDAAADGDSVIIRATE
jgi:hypothetical protein